MKIGVSIFSGLKEYNLESSLEYLKCAYEHGAEMMFTSAHINEADKSIDDLNIIIEKAYEYGIKVVIDVSKNAYENLNLSDKVFCYRLDYGFSDEEIVELSKSGKHYIELNASTLSKEKLEKYLSMGLNIERTRASFNYYPKLYTAHSIGDATKKVEMFKKYGIGVSAFLPSFYGKRPPMYEGLPSIEMHRNQELAISIEELKAIGVSEIYFGDAYASVDEIKLLESHNKDEIVLDVELNVLDENIISYLTSTMRLRPDYNDYLLRFGKTKQTNIEIIKYQGKRKKFDLTIDNILFKRYSGEINLVIDELPYEERVNVIGSVKCSDLIVNNIKEKGYVKLNIINSYDK